MNTPAAAAESRDFVANAVEAAIRIGVLLALAFWCFRILQPFVTPVLWGVVLAIALHPTYCRLARALGGDRRRLAAFLLCLLMLVVLVIPAVVLTETLLSGAENIAAAMQAGTLDLPPPPESVREWPLIGTRVYDFWQLLSENLALALEPALPHIQALGRWLLGSAAGAGLGVLVFILAIVISGVLLANSVAGERTARAIGHRLAGERGKDFVAVAGGTIRSVARGILGVAAIQALLAGIGFLAVGVPGAGFWAMVALFLSIIQIGILPIGLPIIIYVFYTADPIVAVLFTIWIVVVGLLDNVLKPLLLGRGAPVPTLVIFLGAIGGFISAGIVGLFVGSVILALGYRLFLLWLHLAEEAQLDGTTNGEGAQPAE